MALDIYRIEDIERKNRIFSLEDEDMAALSHFFTELEEKTGVSVDAYDDTRLHVDHMKLLSRLITEQLRDGKRDQRVRAFKDFLDKMISEGEALFFRGD
jgi:hypothetical protein